MRVDISPQLKTALKPVHRMSMIGWIVMTFFIGLFTAFVFLSLHHREPDTTDAIYIIVFLSFMALSLASISLILKWYVTSNIGCVEGSMMR